MKRKIIISIFALAAIVQLAVLGSSIVRYENILTTGKVWKFEIEPVDPYDILRGRYVRLRFKKRKLKVASDFFDAEKYYYRKNGYLVLNKKTDGFTEPLEAMNARPESDANWIKCQFRRNYRNKAEAEVSYPFDRFFMNEKLAPEADKVMRRNSEFMKNNRVYITVRVKDGIGVIENFWVDDTPIADFLRQEMKK